jgi:hypothetical protein
LHGAGYGIVGTETSPSWEVFVGDRSAPVNTSWGTTFDVNGDGFADVLIGAPGVNDDTGAVYVYFGGAGGLSTMPNETMPSPGGPGGDFGGSVASAGDVNGDGFPDVLVGTAGNAVSVAYLYLGGVDGLMATPTTLVVPAGGGCCGFSVASAGDVNGDGYSDVIVGGPNLHGSAAGTAFLFLGSAEGLGATPAAGIGGDAPSSEFGYSVASAGDVNGDGFGDIVVSAFAGVVGPYELSLYLGGANGLAASPLTLGPPPGAQGQFGASVAGAGDVNGDGFADVLVGAPSGAAYVYLGGSMGLVPTPFLLTDQTGLRFGYSVASAGDVNGDGFGDVVVGAPGGDGEAYLYLGGPTGISTAPNLSISSAGPNDEFGFSVASAGDVDQDGFADILVGAPGADGYAGAAFVYRVALGAPSAVVLGAFGGPNGAFGTSVAGAAP